MKRALNSALAMEFAMKFKFALPLFCLLLAGCASHRAPPPTAAARTWYDGYFGKVDGYWARDGSFWYSADGKRWLRDGGGHFRRSDGGVDFKPFQTRAAPAPPRR